MKKSHKLNSNLITPERTITPERIMSLRSRDILYSTSRKLKSRRTPRASKTPVAPSTVAKGGSSGTTPMVSALRQQQVQQAAEEYLSRNSEEAQRAEVEAIVRQINFSHADIDMEDANEAKTTTTKEDDKTIDKEVESVFGPTSCNPNASIRPNDQSAFLPAATVEPTSQLAKTTNLDKASSAHASFSVTPPYISPLSSKTPSTSVTIRSPQQSTIAPANVPSLHATPSTSKVGSTHVNISSPETDTTVAASEIAPTSAPSIHTSVDFQEVNTNAGRSSRNSSTNVSVVSTHTSVNSSLTRRASSTNASARSTAISFVARAPDDDNNHHETGMRMEDYETSEAYNFSNSGNNNSINASSISDSSINDLGSSVDMYDLSTMMFDENDEYMQEELEETLNLCRRADVELIDSKKRELCVRSRESFLGLSLRAFFKVSLFMTVLFYLAYRAKNGQTMEKLFLGFVGLTLVLMFNIILLIIFKKFQRVNVTIDERLDYLLTERSKMYNRCLRLSELANINPDSITAKAFTDEKKRLEALENEIVSFYKMYYVH